MINHNAMCAFCLHGEPEVTIFVASKIAAAIVKGIAKRKKIYALHCSTLIGLFKLKSRVVYLEYKHKNRHTLRTGIRAKRWHVLIHGSAIVLSMEFYPTFPGDFVILGESLNLYNCSFY